MNVSEFDIMKPINQCTHTHAHTDILVAKNRSSSRRREEESALVFSTIGADSSSRAAESLLLMEPLISTG